MHLSVSQEKLNEEIGDEYRMEQLTAKIRDTENFSGILAFIIFAPISHCIKHRLETLTEFSQ